MRGRLEEAFLERAVTYGDRILSLVEKLDEDHRPRRVVDQITGSGTSAGAQIFEANELLSRADFIKTIGWAAKELNETPYWLLLIQRRKWIHATRLESLMDETQQLLAISKSLISCSKKRNPK